MCQNPEFWPKISNVTKIAKIWLKTEKGPHLPWNWNKNLPKWVKLLNLPKMDQMGKYHKLFQNQPNLPNFKFLAQIGQNPEICQKMQNLIKFAKIWFKAEKGPILPWNYLKNFPKSEKWSNLPKTAKIAKLHNLIQKKRNSQKWQKKCGFKGFRV